MARVSPLLLAAVMALAVFATFPRGLIPLNDAFGYVRSIALTYEHGRPLTDGWLEPWAAGFSTLGAIVFGLTGSMYLATCGLSALLMGVSAWAGARLLTGRNVSPGMACALTVVLLFFPTVLWKFLEINGFSLYFTCLLLALFSYERKNWLGFTLAWCVAVSTRQSAVAWGVLPAYAAIVAWSGRDKANRPFPLRPLAAILVTAAFFFFLTAFMNKTHAQRVITDHVFANWTLGGSLRPFQVALLAMGVAFGLGSIAMGARRTDTTPAWRRAGAGLLAVLLIIGSLSGDLRTRMEFDHRAFDVGIFYGYLQGLCLLGALGVGLSALRVRLDYALAALGCTTVLMLRAAFWDYYLVDIAVLAFFAATPGTAPAVVAAWKFRTLHYASALLAVLSLAFLVFFKSREDREYAIGTLSARALGRAAIAWSDASFLPFGVMGWYFFPYYSTHDGKDSPDLADFGRYLRRDVVGIAEHYPRFLRRFPSMQGSIPGDRSTILEQDRFTYCWIYWMDVALVKLPADQAKTSKSPYPADLVPPALPLTDAAWRAQLKR